MGSPENEPGRTGNEPLHRVILSRGFWLARAQCTQRLYEQLCGKNPSHFKGPDLPVENLTWEEANESVFVLNREVPLPDGWKWSLPTEAQWEYACRAGTSTPFHFGDVLDGHQANCNGRVPLGTKKKGPFRKKTTPAGSYPANAFGLFDMHGNVSEWCSDWYSELDGGTVTDPTGPAEGSFHIHRGGGWSNYGRRCRAACRRPRFPNPKYYTLGVRFAILPTG